MLQGGSAFDLLTQQASEGRQLPEQQVLDIFCQVVSSLSHSLLCVSALAHCGDEYRSAKACRQCTATQTGSYTATSR